MQKEACDRPHLRRRPHEVQRRQRLLVLHVEMMGGRRRRSIAATGRLLLRQLARDVVQRLDRCAWQLVVVRIGARPLQQTQKCSHTRCWIINPWPTRPAAGCGVPRGTPAARVPRKDACCSCTGGCPGQQAGELGELNEQGFDPPSCAKTR